jgi:hypothetical protein
MDFNYLYHRQQVELARADRAACPPSAGAHRSLAGLFGVLIARKKADRLQAR